MNTPIERKIMIGLLSVLLLMAGIDLDSYLSIHRLVDNTKRAEEALVVRRNAQGILLTMLNLETAARAFVITGQDMYLQEFQHATAKINSDIAEMPSLFDLSPKQQGQFREMADCVGAALSIDQNDVNLSQKKDNVAAAREIRLGMAKRQMDRLRALVNEIAADQDSIRSEDNRKAADQAQRATWAIVVGSTCGFLFAVGLGWMVRNDIQRRKDAADKIAFLNGSLIEQNEQLESTNRELESFCYSVSHDLRTPLRSMDGFSQALLEDCADKLDAEAQDHLQRIRCASQRMGHLIDDLLNLSKVTRVPMNREAVDLSKMAREALEEVRGKESQRDAEFVIADGLVTQGDQGLLRSAMANLLGNAWKFTAKRAHTRIEFGSSVENGSKVFFVRDNGVGFDMTYAGKLFGAFQRLHGLNEYPGNGIGLATVQRIILRHGGRIWAESKVDAGTTVRFTL